MAVPAMATGETPVLLRRTQFATTASETLIARCTIRRSYPELLSASLAVGLTLFLTSCGGGGGGGTPTPQNPQPSVTSISPTSANAGDGAFTLTVNGSSFISSSVVRWNGANRATNFVSATQLTASIPATDVASAGSASVTVFNPSPGGGTSGAVTFSITTGVPILTSLSPSAAPAGTPDFTMTVSGSGFANTSVVLWNGTPRATTFVTNTQLDAQIPASDVASTGTAQVTVETPPPGGGTSGPLPFQIISAPAGRNDTRATATAVSKGTIPASISPYGDEDFYSFQATAGATVTVEITARRLASPSQLDSAIEIVDGSGTRPTTGCRSPDHPFDPIAFAENDPTPTAFDDECVNDDISLGVLQDSRLEFQPTLTGTYFVHVVDLRGDGRPDLNYELTLSGAD